MNWNIINLQEELRKPLQILGYRYGFGLDENGIELYYEETEEKVYEMEMRQNSLSVKTCSKSAFYRAVCQASEEAGELCEGWQKRGRVWFDFNGLMVDCSRNGVINISYAKEVIEILAACGMNVFMLYMEDVYQVDGEDYFGLLRGRYSRQELKDIDDYAALFNIEVIPCIQSLAHMNQFLQWEEMYHKYVDIDDVLLVGNEATYGLLDRMIRQLSETFRSRRIHIGMDEAYNLGRGRYADINGLCDKVEILQQHLVKVTEILEKYGMRAIIWDDMFFSHYSSAEDHFRVPENVDLMYWDYYHLEEEHYDTQIRQRGQKTDHLMFAGGAWKWVGYAPHHSRTMETTNSALSACKKNGVRDVMVTAWGDDGCECPVSAMLFGTVLFAEHQYSEKVSQEMFSKRLEFLTGMGYEDFMRQEEIDIYPEFPEKSSSVNPGKYTFYEDPLVSLFVYHTDTLEGNITAHYEELEHYFAGCSAVHQKNPALRAAQEFYSQYCRVMKYKWNLGSGIYHAYQKGDRSEILRIAENQLKPAIAAMEDLRLARMKEWYLTSKSAGFEVLDIRMAGVKQRMETALQQLMLYLDGTLDRMEELEEARKPVVPFREEGMGEAIHFNRCLRSMTPARMTW